MLEKLQFYVDGQWVDAIEPRSLDVINPATEEPMGRISLGSAADVDRAVEIAGRPGVILTTFGDMMRVPGSSGDLIAGARYSCAGSGADIRPCAGSEDEADPTGRPATDYAADDRRS